jgi:DNA-binding PadR family transcriptional regulator
MLKIRGMAMSIQYAILGLLSWKPLTGYDLKKIIQESAFMYWSANNNQIYKSLIQLLNEGLATSETRHQESLPSKKVYTITDEGRKKLDEWVSSAPELPEFKKNFLIQLAWAGSLEYEKLDALLMGYEEEIRLQVLARQELKKRGVFMPGQSERERFLWEAINDNILDSYEAELTWVRSTRNAISEKKLL